MSLLAAARDHLTTTPGVDARAEDVWHCLKNDRRRHTIHILATHPVGERLAVSDLASQLATRRHGPRHSARERKAAYVSLQQTHIDVLATVNAVTATDTAAAVTVGQTASALADIIDAVDARVDA